MEARLSAESSQASGLIRWDGPAHVDEPLIEAVMFGQSGNAGVSLRVAGRS